MYRHCEQCSKILKPWSNTKAPLRFCSRLCSVNSLNASNPRSRPKEEIEQIVQMKLDGIPYKVIARKVGCTPDAARHIFRQHKSRGSMLYKTLRYKERNAARDALAAEIAAAKAEKATAAPYKVGLLGEW